MNVQRLEKHSSWYMAFVAKICAHNIIKKYTVYIYNHIYI
jgi:hypothetical protein